MSRTESFLCGTHERGVETLEPNLEAKRRILDGHARFFEALQGAGVG